MRGTTLGDTASVSAIYAFGSSLDRRSKALAVANDLIRAELANHFVFIGRMGNRDRLESGGLRILHGEVPETADAEHGHALVRLGISPPKAAPYCIAGAEDGSRLLVRNVVGDQEGAIGIHQHVLGVPALKIHSGVFLIGAESPAAALAPFAAPAGGLNPCGPHAISDFSRGDVGGHSNNLADRFVPENSGKLAGNVAKGLVYVGVTDAACVHFYQDLIGAGLRLGNVFQLPGTAHGRDDCSLHT